jgi:hypothetical protein
MSSERGSRRALPIALTLLIALALLAGGCGTTTRSPSAAPVQPVALTPWPSVSDYQTIKTAVAVRDNALFHQTDWRRKSFAASLALRTLVTVRMAVGHCAAYVTELYGNLRDLADAYPHEDWRPLVRTVRREPSLAAACQHPRPAASIPAA